MTYPQKQRNRTPILVVLAYFIVLMLAGCSDPDSPETKKTEDEIKKAEDEIKEAEDEVTRTGDNENGPFSDVTPNVIKLKTFVVRAPSVQVYAGARGQSDLITDDMFLETYSEELNNIMFGDDKTFTYFSTNSFGKMQLESSLQKEVIVLDSYPETQPQSSSSQPRVIDINAVNVKLGEKLSEDDIMENDIIMVYLLSGPDLRLERQGIQSSFGITRDGRFLKSMRLVYYSWMPTENFITEVKAVQGETFNPLNTLNPIRASAEDRQQGIATAPVKYTNLHEWGHALGFFRHADIAQRDDYGNKADIMGLGTISVGFNPGIKDQLGWLSPETTSTLEGAVSTRNITLVPTHGSTDGTRVLKLATSVPELYYYIYFYGKDDPFLAANLDPGKATFYADNGKGIFIVSDDGVSNRIKRAANSDFDTFTFLDGQSYRDSYIEVTNIVIDEQNQSASFDVKNFVSAGAQTSNSAQ